MLSRLDDDEANDTSFAMDSSVESIENDKVFEVYRQQRVNDGLREMSLGVGSALSNNREPRSADTGDQKLL